LQAETLEACAVQDRKVYLAESRREIFGRKNLDQIGSQEIAGGLWAISDWVDAERNEVNLAEHGQLSREKAALT
jgi:hypothetical protein